MSGNKQSFTCMIHEGILVNPVTCDNCANNFCLECANESKRRRNFCPYCKTTPFNLKRNYMLENIIKKIGLVCPNCGKTFPVEEEDKYDEHIEFCEKISCPCCNELFNNTDIYKNHFLADEKHLIFLSDRFDDMPKKNVNPMQPGIYQDPLKPRRFLNLLNKARNSDISADPNINFENEDSLIRNNIDVPNKCVLDEGMDLFFCYSNTGNQCSCCNDHICKPGNCLCKNCMELNKKYHGLKNHYLINKAGRAARYSRRHFHCYCKFIKQVINENGNVFNNKFFCGDITYCPACSSLDELMDYYLGDVANTLRNRL